MMSTKATMDAKPGCWGCAWAKRDRAYIPCCVCCRAMEMTDRYQPMHPDHIRKELSNESRKKTKRPGDVPEVSL
jgi:hypothetical protein